MSYSNIFLRNVEAALQMVDAAKQELANKRESERRATQLRKEVGDRHTRSAPPTDPMSRKGREEAVKNRIAEEKRKEEEAKALRTKELTDRGIIDPDMEVPDLAKEFLVSSADAGDYDQDISEEEILAGLATPEQVKETIVADQKARADEGMKRAAQRFFGMSDLEDSPAFEPSPAPGKEETKLPGPQSLAELKGQQAAQPPKAVPVEPDEGKMRDYFRVATGTAYNPKSSRDKAYMEKISRALRENPDLAELSPRQFAVKLYAMG